MKKILKVSVCFILILCVLGIAGLSAKSTKKSKNSEATEQTDTTNQTLLDKETEDEIRFETATEAIREEEKKIIESPFKKKKAVDENDPNRPAWIGTGNINATVENQIGAVKIKAIGKLGTFNIYSIDERGKAIPVFATTDEFTSTSFYLLCGKKVYKLSGGLDRISGAEKTENGIRLRYYIKNVAEVLVDFTIFKSEPNRDADMVKITTSVKSFTKRTTIYGLKIVMDTVLGEKTRYHFYNSSNIPIKSEVMYRTMQKTRWITSKNETAALQILFCGADISPLDFVAVANYETVNTMSWEPNMLTERTFNTVRSYNNSAVDINWMPKNIAPNEDEKFIFYLAFGNDDDPPRGAEFLAANTKQKNTDDSSEKTTVIETAVSEATPFVDFNYDSTRSGKLSPEYIQRLLDRIAMLKEEDPNLNRDELLLLNRELDIILDDLRKQ